MHAFYHGTKDTAAIMNAIIGNGRIRPGFHMTPDPEVAANYGRIIKITVESDIKSAHVGLINKESNHNAAVGHGIEVVLKTPAAIVEFYKVLDDAVIVH